MKKPFLSIVIPTLNEQKLLPRLLDSLAWQSYRDFEVIVVDGKSKDKTVTEAKKFIKKLPKLKIYLSLIKNAGKQRNMGAEKAVGQYLVFFDADVLIPENFLEEVSKYIKSEKVDLLTTSITTAGHKMQNLALEAILNVGSEVVKMMNKPFAGGYNIIIRRSVFKKVGGFDAEIIHGEDFEFTIRCHEAGYNLHILKNPRIVFSTRRVDKYGLMDVLKKGSKSAFYVLSGKPLKKPVFDYQMGGDVYPD